MESETLYNKKRKRALITGASRGIGAGIAIALAKEGYDLILVCRKSIEKLTDFQPDLELTYGVRCETYLCDVSDSDEVEKLFSVCGEVDVLINNAAISYVGLLTDMSVSEWQQVINTNLNALFYTCRQVLPGMIHRKSGKIINVSSVWGAAGASMEVAYSAAKGGVNAFTKALAKEVAPSHIQVNAVAFGVIDTEMNACFTKEEKQALIEEIPADRMGTAQEAGELVARILESPDYLTGQVITMDGGWI